MAQWLLSTLGKLFAPAGDSTVENLPVIQNNTATDEPRQKRKRGKGPAKARRQANQRSGPAKRQRGKAPAAGAKAAAAAGNSEEAAALDAIEKAEKAGDCLKILEILKGERNLSEAAIQSACLASLARFAAAKNSTKDRNALLKGGVSEATVAAMAAHADNLAVAQTGVELVMRLAPPTHGQLRLIKANACEALVAALNAHIEDPKLVANGCVALASLANEDDGALRRLAEAGVAETLVRILKIHVVRKDVLTESEGPEAALTEACFAVSELLSYGEGGNPVAEQLRSSKSGAEAAVKAALDRYPAILATLKKNSGDVALEDLIA